MREVLITAVSAFLMTSAGIFSLSLVDAQVRQSTNYRLESDSINIGGGLSTSTSYTLESTAGEVATGESDSTSFGLGAGYQQMQESYISISDFGAVVLSPSIPGVSGGYANGSTTVRVVTDNAAGYLLQIAASQSPAMQKESDTIEDYVTAGSDPDFTFITDAADAHFGYTPEGTDIVDQFKDNGSVCNTGGLDTSLACWAGLSTTDETIAQGGAANHPLGATTTLHFRVGVGGAVLQSPGFYTATTTITALTL